jgi:hypothetical protein
VDDESSRAASAPWLGRRPTLAVLASALLTTAIATAPAYWLGRRTEERGHLLRNYRVPAQWERVESTMTYALQSSERNDVIFLGSSSCETAVDTRRFQECTGLTAYTLAAQGLLGLDAELLIMRRYLEHHPAPRLVVFVVHPLELGEPKFLEAESRERFFRCYGDRTAAPGPRSLREVSEDAREGIRSVYGTLRGGLRYFTNAPQSTFDGRLKSYNEWITELRERRGYWEIPDAFPAERPVPEPTRRYPVSTEAATELRALGRLAGERGFRVLIRLAPVVGRGAPSGEAPLLSALQNVLGDCPRVTISRPVLLPLEAALFRDIAHTHSGGAAVFTAFLVKTVPEAIGAPADRRVAALQPR